MNSALGAWGNGRVCEARSLHSLEPHLEPWVWVLIIAKLLKQLLRLKIQYMCIHFLFILQLKNLLLNALLMVSHSVHAFLTFPMCT